MYASERRATAKKKQPTSLPNPQNATEMQAFFLQEVQLGEELLADGTFFFIQVDIIRNERTSHVTAGTTECQLLPQPFCFILFRFLVVLVRMHINSVKIHPLY